MHKWKLTDQLVINKKIVDPGYVVSACLTEYGLNVEISRRQLHTIVMWQSPRCYVDCLSVGGSPLDAYVRKLASSLEGAAIE